MSIKPLSARTGSPNRPTQATLTPMLQTTLALILFLFPLAYSPGPGNMFFAANGARFGLRATISANLGYHLATLIVTGLIGLGIIAALDQAPDLFKALKLAGAGYVLWIAWKMFRSGAMTDVADARPASFGDGFVLLVLNPKGYVIMTLMFTQFLSPAEPNRLAMIALLSVVFTLNNMFAFVVWTLLGDQIAGLLRSERSARWLNMGFGAVLAAVAVWMMWL